jgi:uncharacterized protein YjbJ (UPF0337 family)
MSVVGGIRGFGIGRSGPGAKYVAFALPSWTLLLTRPYCVVERFRLGSAQEIKEVAGKVLGDAKLESEGKADQAAGKVQNAVGGVKDTVLGAILDLVGYLQTPLGAVLAIAALAVFYSWAVGGGSSQIVERRPAESAPGLALFNPPVTIFLKRMKS